jgi:hypothetical protein
MAKKVEIRSAPSSKARTMTRCALGLKQCEAVKVAKGRMNGVA